MVNLGLNWASAVAIVLFLSGAGLYFLRTMRPALARDHDIFFAAIALLSGGILFFQGWRLDPILQFAQFLTAGSAIWFAYEAVRLRGVTTEQAKRSTPVIDDERPVSRVYRAELDELTSLDERSSNRRIWGSREGRPDDYYDDYREEARRRPASRSSDRYGAERPRKSRTARPLPPDRSTSRNDGWGDELDDRSSRNYSTDASRYEETSRPSSADTPSPRKPSKPGASPRRRSSESRSSDYRSDYVDYQSIDYPEE